MKLQEFLKSLAIGHRNATVDDVRHIFADYHDALHWLAGFLIDEERAAACVVDACKIAERQGHEFHEWLAHYAARATLRCALRMQREEIAELGPGYERFERVHANRWLLSAQELQCLVEQTEALRIRLDILCRFVLVMHGIAKESFDEVAGQLGVSPKAVERAYCVAFDTLHITSQEMRRDADRVSAPAM